MARGPESPSLYKEYVGKAAKWGGVIAGLIGIINLNAVLIVVGFGIGVYGNHIEQKNK